jgi:hypothetical protein
VDVNMNVKIGVADSSKLIELEIDDLKGFKKELDSAVKAGDIAWFTDAKGNEVAVPGSRISYVEIESQNNAHRVGFGPGA